jgi:hypothetical protein
VVWEDKSKNNNTTTESVNQLKTNWSSEMGSEWWNYVSLVMPVSLCEETCLIANVFTKTH